MISWQSIMSVFNTKGTLLKWLKTLDQSLKDGVLQSVSVNPVSTGVITLTFNFADGSTVTTPQITLPAGEQGPQGVPGTDGTDGTDGTNGRDALVQNRALSSANISSPMAIPIEALNRTAVVGEPIVMFATDTTENKTYMLIGTVTNVGSPGVNPYVFVTYSNKIDITGPQGAPGTSPTVNIIEYADELPTATADSPDFVQTPDGTLYRKKAVEGAGLVGTTYTFKNSLSALITSSNTFNLSFTINNGTSYSSIKVNKAGWSASLNYDDTKVWGSPAAEDADFYGWHGDVYKEITITNISSLTNVDEFVIFINSVATSTGGGASVSYEYVALADAT